MELADSTVPNAPRESLRLPSSSSPEPSTESATAESVVDLAQDYSPRTLRHELKTRGRLTTHECLAVGIAMAAAIEYLHRSRLVHRDIKPSNIVYVNGRPKLADIGLVADMGDEHSIVGTEGYLPPEGAGTPEADVYSLGKVLYEVSTGLDRRHFPELPAEAVEPSELVGMRELNAIVLKACARLPADRYPTATALRIDLERLEHGRSIQRLRMWETLGGRVRRLAPAIGTAAVILMILWEWIHWNAPSTAAPNTERAAVFVLPFRIGGTNSTTTATWQPNRLTDAIIDGLASLEGVRRSPRKSGWITRPERELRESLARTNNMRHVLTGELRQNPDGLGLHLELSDRSTQRPIWARTLLAPDYATETLARMALSNLLHVLAIPVDAQSWERIERLIRSNAEAGRKISAGFALYDRDDMVYASYTRIISLAEEARRLDPLYLDARYLRASMLRDLALFSRPPAEIWPENQREMETILQYDDTHTGALNFMCSPTWYRDWNWVGHDAWVQRQLKWESEYGKHAIYSVWLRSHGQFEQARVHQAFVEKPDLRERVHDWFLLTSRWVYRNYDEGIGLGKQILEITPDRIWPHHWLAHLYVDGGYYEEGLKAIEKVEQVNAIQGLTALRGYAFARMGQAEKARDVLHELIEQQRTQPYLQPYFVARIYAALGDKESALDWLERAEQERSEHLVFADFGGLRTDPAWDQLQDHPRFLALLKKVGLDVWPVPIQPLKE
ncbi:MAG: protein kinase [Verrucomicrobiales bacterium]|nr:protein kinase [Verrucomicrobiales bacterium]